MRTVFTSFTQVDFTHFLLCFGTVPVRCEPGQGATFIAYQTKIYIYGKVIPLTSLGGLLQNFNVRFIRSWSLIFPAIQPETLPACPLAVK